MSILLADPTLNDIAETKHSFKANFVPVHWPACIDYIKRINHELARRNRDNSKKSAPGREDWYVASATACTAWYERQQQDTAAPAIDTEQHQPQPQSRAKAAAAPRKAATTVEGKAAGHGDKQKQKKDAAKQKKGAGNDTVSGKLERAMEGRVCADTGVMLYHCHWAGFTPDDDTWEPRDHIRGNPEFFKFQRNGKDVDEFHESFDRGLRSTVGEQAKATKKAPKRVKPRQP